MQYAADMQIIFDRVYYVGKEEMEVEIQVCVFICSHSMPISCLIHPTEVKNFGDLATC